MEGTQQETRFNKKQQPKEKGNLMMRQEKFQHFMKYANIFYRTIGIKPYKDHELGQQETKGNIFLANFIFLFQFLNMNINASGEIAFVAQAIMNGNNFIEATYSLSYLLFIMVSYFKILFVWLKKSNLTQLVDGLKEIFPKHKNAQKNYNLTKYLKQCSFISLSFSWLYMILIWTYNLMAIVKYFVGFYLLGMKDVEPNLPYIMHIPWNYKHHWSYYIVYAGNNLAGYTAAAGQISSDLFLTACASQLIMHFDYLAESLTNFTCSECLTKDMQFLKAAIHYHNNLLDLCEQLNEIFGIPLLLNFCISAFVICFVGFQLTTGPSLELLFKLSLYLISSTVQVYLICYFGQQLVDCSSNVASAVYNQTWYYSDVRFQKMLIIIAQRAQKPAQLKATKLVPVSINTFAQIMQISYKFFALLRTMFEI